MKRFPFLFVLFTTFPCSIFAQPDTVPNCYCDCIDTSKIIGNKHDFFQSFEQIILKKSLEEIQQFDSVQLHEYYTNPYYYAFCKKKVRFFSGQMTRSLMS